MKLKVLGITMALLATLSCMKEEAQEQPVDGGQERFAEYDPVVRFGLDTYMGAADDTAPFTKTTYAGDDKTFLLLNKVRYERINWNGKSETDENKPGYQDVIQIISQTNFTPKGNKTSVSYKVVEIPGTTNPNDNSREDYADAAPSSGSNDDNFYWSRPHDPVSAKDAKYYFYSVYPTSESTVRPSTKVVNFSLDKTDPDPAKHLAHVSASINKKEGADPDNADAPCREQKYLEMIPYTDGLLGKSQDCYEYLPDMKNAYLYAAAVMPGADAGYKKVPLRFKPLYSAVKLIVTAADAGAKNYRLKRVDLRTDLHNNGDNSTSPDRLDLNDSSVGTALGGSFSTYFKADATSGTTADFARIDPAHDPNTALSDTLKRLFIAIDKADRMVLGDNVLKLTFLVLPIEQKVMTVDYTFEYRKDDSKGWDEPGNLAEVHRYLSLQQKTSQKDNKGYRNEFTNNDWFTLDPANKLYVRSNVPEIEYVFKVQAQGNFPRTWNSGDDIKDGTHYYSDDFYSVQSYRDSSGVKQSMKWKVTGYKNPGDAKFEMVNRPAWLRLRGDDGTWDPDLEISDLVNHGWDAGGDPWEEPWGAGTPMENGDFSTSSKFVSHARNYIKGSSFVSYVSAAEANEGGYSRNESLDSDGKPDVFENNRDWDVPVSYLCRDLDGKYYYQENHTHTPSAGWKGLQGEAYAYDLSSHDIYGNLIVDKNGDLGTTANCYVVSAPGWYRFPAVYGNSLKNGGDNIKAYNKGGTESTGIMGAFLDHNANGIDSPVIPGIDAVEVLWDDANHMVAPSTTVSTRADRKPFYHKDPSETYGYIYFYVDDIAQGNALLVAKSGSTIVWSWHIWAVTKPGTFLRTVGVESNKKDKAGNDNLYQSIYGTNYMWQKTDLGQHGTEQDVVDPRYCDVEFTQYFRGKVVKKVVVRFLQSGVNDSRQDPLFYQWGRKDPFPRDRIGVANGSSGITVENTHQTIMNPNLFYGGNSHNVANGKRYDNLWNVNITTAPSTPKSDGTATGSLDRKVEKTIYDPSPPGFHMANLYALSGFNAISPIYETKVPRVDANLVAYNARTQTYYKGRRYYDFYAEYDETVPYKRKLTGETIRFYCLGRINAAGFDNPGGDSTNQAYYFFSEPGAWNENTSFYGRSFWIGGEAVGTGQWQIYPVCGTADMAKWQRNHALPVRPMAEQ